MADDVQIQTERVSYAGDSFRIRCEGRSADRTIVTTLEKAGATCLSKTTPYYVPMARQAVGELMMVEMRALRERLLGGHLDIWLAEPIDDFAVEQTGAETEVSAAPIMTRPPVSVVIAPEAVPVPLVDDLETPLQFDSGPVVDEVYDETSEPTSVSMVSGLSSVSGPISTLTGQTAVAGAAPQPKVPPRRRSSRPGRWAVRIGHVEDPFPEGTLPPSATPVPPSPGAATTQSTTTASQSRSNKPGSGPGNTTIREAQPVQPNGAPISTVGTTAAEGSRPARTASQSPRTPKAPVTSSPPRAAQPPPRTHLPATGARGSALPVTAPVPVGTSKAPSSLPPKQGRLGPYYLLDRLDQDRYVALRPGSRTAGFVRLDVVEAPERIDDDMRALVRLEHSALLPLLDMTRWGKRLLLAHPYGDDIDAEGLLMQCVKTKRPVPVDVVGWVAREVARALDYLHARSWAHGSLELRHILLGGNGQVRMAGVWHALVDRRAATAQADLRAVGALMLALIGRGEREKELMPARAPFVPPTLVQVANRALAAGQSADGFRSAEALVTALTSYLDRDAPRTDTGRVARLLGEMFPEAEKSRQEVRTGLEKTAQLLDDQMREANTSNTPLRPGESMEDGAEQELEPGTIVDNRYLISRLCGRGGMGWVYEAEHQAIGRKVALKVLHPMYSRAPDVAERFRREARAASRIGHPNIIEVYDFGRTESSCLYIAMEMLDGKDLGALLEEVGALEIPRSLEITEQVCEALSAAHAVGIIHRDLKPENVFLIDRQSRELVKVLDFGIAKHLEETKPDGERLTRPNIALGTPEYMAPEQVGGETDPRSDIYSVGTMLYEMLVGVPPFEGEHYLEVFRRKSIEEPVPPSQHRSDIDAEIDKLVLRALARDPNDRFPSMTAFADAVRAERRRLAG